MAEPSEKNSRISDTIAGRVRPGDEPIVAGWQEYLTNVLVQMRPYMAEGRMVTFQRLLTAEREFFETLLSTVTVPDHVVSIYIAPSVRYQMLVTNHGPGTRVNGDHDPENPPDAGIVLASSSEGFEVILNALFAFSPTLPAVDIYDRGQLIGGYSYHTIEECLQDLSDLMRTYL